MSEKKSVLSALGSFFVEEVPDKDSLPSTKSAGSAVQVPSVPVAVAPVLPPVKAVDSEYAQKLDAAATSSLSRAMEKVAGSYAEYFSNMDALSEAVPDEAARTKAVLKLLSKKGVSLHQLLSDADACLGALEEENRVFITATKDQIDQKVGAKRKAVDQIAAEIASKQAQIAALQNDISALTAKQSTSASEIQAEEDNIAVVRIRFTHIFNTMKASLASQRANLVSQGG